jgi:hypothetical protein
MRRDKVLRFLVIAFAVGAFLGLIFGLAFGGGSSTTPSLAGSSDAGGSPATTSPPNPADTASEPMSSARAQIIGANEMGEVLVLVYHQISTETGESARSPDDLRDDLSRLRSENFYPVNLKDYVAGNIDVPAGKSPVVITFDGSSPGQYRIQDDGTVDPDSAAGILQKAAESDDWASRATFFCLLDTVPKENELFGQSDRQSEKLKTLVSWGYEVGSNTVSGQDLSDASAETISEELARSQDELQNRIGGSYVVISLALPLGKYPGSTNLLAQGEYQDLTYEYTAVVGLGDTPALSPFSTDFDPLHIPRITATAEAIQAAIDNFKEHPELRYVSDGDSTSVSAPEDLASGLGDLRDDLGRPLFRY